jgi:hypothetical protein
MMKKVRFQMLCDRQTIDLRENVFKAFIFQLAGCVNHDPFSCPWVILVAHHTVPHWKGKSSHVWLSGLNIF